MLRPMRRQESDEMRPVQRIQEHTNQERTKPVLLYNDECAVCRRIGGWVQKSAQSKSGKTSIIVRPIGDDPEALRLLNPELDIWDAYATIHVLMPNGTMRLGGEAVAEVLRNLHNTKWFAWSFSTAFSDSDRSSWCSTLPTPFWRTCVRFSAARVAASQPSG
jgi:predicted DCC family thiol-disulfide oxidoreductase YuxK